MKLKSTIVVKYNLSDTPANACLRNDCYQKLWNLTTSERERVFPL
jgi:hypothetical protein